MKYAKTITPQGEVIVSDQTPKTGDWIMDKDLTIWTLQIQPKTDIKRYKAVVASSFFISKDVPMYETEPHPIRVFVQEAKDEFGDTELEYLDFIADRVIAKIGVSKFQFTKEDMERAYNAGFSSRDNSDKFDEDDFKYETSKLPVSFDKEYICPNGHIMDYHAVCSYPNCMTLNEYRIKTTTDANGQKWCKLKS